MASCLQMIGYDVNPIARILHLGGSCDLAATRGTELLLIEVKTWETPRRASELLARGEAVALGGRLDRNDKDLPKLKKAAAQLAASARSIDATSPTQVAWFRLKGPGDRHARLRLFSALYGVQFRRIIAGPRLGIANLVPCFNARWPTFCDMLNVSGVVTESMEGVGLWSNPWSNDGQPLLQSHLAVTLQRFHAVFQLSQEGPYSLYVVDDACAGEEQVAADLKQKYGLATVPSAPDDARSTSAAWPGSECGECVHIPGADCLVPQWQLSVSSRSNPTSSS